MGGNVKFELDGKSVTAEPGETVMQVARREKVSIPHFCWHPGLSVAGVCRFCMVEVEGRPKLEIACNLPVSEGMVVRTQSEKAKEAHKWALEFHLINHPLDCPICDQAGECGLQDYYMSVGRYSSQMHRPKVLKPKATEIGTELVLDSERCILCSRCVRFEDEVTQTGALGIFDRGDRSILGTYDGEPIKHRYQENLVDICPVGAFTSKQFRFKQRVWFLKEQRSVCPGCSTGCSISLHYKPTNLQYFRIKPAPDPEVNEHWMCDAGRRMFEHLNAPQRLHACYVRNEENYEDISLPEAETWLVDKIRTSTPDKIALVVTPQYTSEELEAVLELFVNDLGLNQVFQWRERSENRLSFDGILRRGDANPNTAGLAAALEKVGLPSKTHNQLDACTSKSWDLLIVLGPEVEASYPSLQEDLQRLRACAKTVSYSSPVCGAVNSLPWDHGFALSAFCEKPGSFLNANGQQRPLGAGVTSVVPQAVNLETMAKELSALAKGEDS